MEQNKNNETEKKKETIEEKTDRWIEKANDYIDDAAEKIHKSKAYKKTDGTMEKATKSIFRKAGKLWGKSEKYFKKKKD
ncbi:MAG: hypothetical protein ACOCWD_05170 [Tangfeifania sp.]